MSFTDIALKSAVKKAGSYLAYFFSTAFSVLIFQLFCSMYYNPTFEAYRFGPGKMNTLFRASAVAVLLFAAVFTLYSGSYFLRTQKKEIALYSLLGMRKGRIALLMFTETFFIGLAALVCGVALGALSSQYFTGLLLRFMAIGTQVDFSFEPRSALVTALCFCALFCVSGLRAYRTIYRYQLSELLSAEKRTEGIPGYSVPGAALSALLLAAGYAAAACLDLNQPGMRLLLPVFLVVLVISLGTYLLFRNFVPMAICWLKSKRGLYYRATDFVGISQIAFRLKANSRLLAVVSLLTAVTVTMISASVSLYRGLEDAVDFYAPYSYLAKDLTEEQRAELLGTIAKLGEVSVTAMDDIPLCNVEIQNDAYALQDDKTNSPIYGAVVEAYLLSESKYLDILAHTGTPVGEYGSTRSSFTGGLKAGECYFIDGNMTGEYCKGLVGRPLSVSMDGAEAEYTVTGAGLHKYIGLADLYRHPTIVVSDGVYSEYAAKAGENGVTSFLGLMFDDEMGSAKTVDALNNLVPPRFSDGGMPVNVSYIGYYRANFALYGSYVFIGLFIGVLFMLAVGSVMYYKLIMEAQEEAPRYGILRKLGMTGRELRLSVAKQLGLTYGLPLAVGLVHTVFALLTYNRMLLEMGEETPTLLNAMLTALVYIAVYFVFYLLSVRSYSRIAIKGEA